MIVSNYETSVTREHRTTGKRIEPSLRNGRAKPGIASFHQGKADDAK